jgi:hypothetical protein
MKTEKNKKFNQNAAKALMSAASLLALQGLPMSLAAQTEKASPMLSKFVIKLSNFDNASKFGGTMTQKGREDKLLVVAFNNGNPVFKNKKGELFTVNRETGDLVFVTSEEFSKFSCCMKCCDDAIVTKIVGKKSTMKMHIKFADESVMDVSLLGKDEEGHAIQKNSRGEAFYMDPASGDLIYVTIQK